jgi:hypothetical protein
MAVEHLVLGIEGQSHNILRAGGQQAGLRDASLGGADHGPPQHLHQPLLACNTKRHLRNCSLSTRAHDQRSGVLRDHLSTLGEAASHSPPQQH